MKKLLALILAMVMAFSITACGKTEPTDGDVDTPPKTEDVLQEDEKANEETQNEDEKADEQEKPQDKKPVKEETPAEKPAQTPTQAPAEKPAEKPAEAPKTVGNNLLSIFKANSSGSALSVAEKLVEKGNFPFPAAAMEVEPGLLSGFDNAEITGFKSGARFGPMMGSIAFIGYVFELEDGASAADFIKNLKENANLRWNICVEAEEMVTGSAGNKVFFVMCPKEFKE